MSERIRSLWPRKALSMVLAVWAATSCGSKSKDDSPSSQEKPKDTLDGGINAPSSFIASAGMPVDDSDLVNLDDIIARLDLKAYHDRGYRGKNLTIAVLDNGYFGLDRSIGRRLPPWVKVEPSPNPDMQQTNHGTKMAEIAYAVASGQRFYKIDVNGPRILLFNANGYTNLNAAVNGVIKAKVDMVLYSQVWEYGGNWDGGGFINKLISKATASGVLWVNAAGNLGQTTYSAAIDLSPSRQVMLPDPGNSIRFSVPQTGTPVKIVLAWNDFKDTKDHRTEQDLDLILTDDRDQEINSSKLVQSGTKNTTAENYSAHAREIIQAQLKSGVYRLKVVAKSSNFNRDSRLRLTVDGNGVRMFNPTSDQSLPIPADNPSVLAIAANDVEYSGKNSASTFPGRKPEISLKSYVAFNDGMGYYGTSAATAITVGALAAYQSAWGKLDRTGVLALLQRGVLNSQSLKLPAPPRQR
jgi:hypothetical protein